MSLKHYKILGAEGNIETLVLESNDPVTPHVKMVNAQENNTYEKIEDVRSRVDGEFIEITAEEYKAACAVFHPITTQ